jgi:hypothetical protein
MARCPLCSVRSAKRFCPAKSTEICPVCCGTKREIEIDCPGDCPHLKAGRTYESAKRPPDPELMAMVERFDEDFLQQFSPILDVLSRAVNEERQVSPWLVDNDVIETYKALTATLKTLSGGIYYESLPEGPLRIALFQRLRRTLDELMQPQPDARRDALKVSEAIEVTSFLTLAATANASGRPRSRQYLDWLSRMIRGAAEPPGTLVLP